MKIIYLLMLVLGLQSCGESPLLNHSLESAPSEEGWNLASIDSFEFKKSKYSFLIDWEVGPKMGESKLILKSWHKDQGTVSGPYQNLPHTLKVFIWMPAMGHGSSPVTIKKVGNGEYKISKIHFIMGGKWDLHVQLLKGGQVFDEIIIPYNI